MFIIIVKCEQKKYFFSRLTYTLWLKRKNFIKISIKNQFPEFSRLSDKNKKFKRLRRETACKSSYRNKIIKKQF